MVRITLAIALASAALAFPTFAQTAPAASSAEALKEDLVLVALQTSLGRIVIAVDRGRAPVTAANFLRYVEAKRFDGESFYRAMKIGSTGGLAQGGIRSDSRKLFPAIDHEPTSKTGLKHVAGAVSLANAGAGTGRADFFILTTDIPSFDATAADAGFAVFGKVIEGMEVVKAIQAAPVSATKGDGPMKGQMLEPTIKIVRATRIKPQ